jgi:hypothetical protein
MAQKQIYKDRVSKELSVTDFLAERQNEAYVMKAPYSIFAKKLGKGEYSWVCYTIGRPQNIIWGTVNTSKGSIMVQYGCNYTKTSTLEKMLEIRSKSGYVLITTLSKDLITERLIRQDLPLALKLGGALDMPAYPKLRIPALYIPASVLQEKMQSICEKEDLINMFGRCTDMAKVIDIMVDELKGKVNRSDLSDTSNIPEAVAAAIVDFIEHTRNTGVNIPELCKSFEECEDDSNSKTCRLYGYDFDTADLL